MRRIFIGILICLLGAGVFSLAFYLDNEETHWVRQNTTETTTPAEETTAPVTEASTPEETAEQTLATEPVQTQPAETTVPETLSGETEPEETGAAENEETDPSQTVPETTATVPAETEAEEPAVQSSASAGRSYVLTFVGDCTLGTTESIYYAPLGFIKTVGEDYDYPFANVRTYFENDDLTLLNLEGPLTDEGSPCGAVYSFRGPSEYINILSGSSVEVVSLANNHALDYGPAGYASTKALLEGADIDYVEDDGTTIITLDDGLTIGIYGSMFATATESHLTQKITALREQGVDLIIYAPHWGVERSYPISWTQDSLGHAAIDAGADIVWGCHPHVLQQIEEYNGGVIYYSLGNFSFGGNSAPGDMDTAVIQQEIILQEDGSVVLGERTIIPCCLSSSPSTNNYQPTPYEPGTKEYDRVLRKLDGTYTP